MNIRKAQLDDYENIARTHAVSYLTMHKGLVPDSCLASLSVETFIERWQQRIVNDETLTYLAEENKKIIGLVTVVNPALVKDKEEGVELKFFYIHPDFWRHGIGGALMQV